MKENRIRETLDEISMREEKKKEVWDVITKASGRSRRYLRKRVAAAAAVLVLLLIPVGIQAAGVFQWDWEGMDEKNQPLDIHFQRENGYIEGGGFRFVLERAMCSPNIGVAYYYISVTDVSGQGRNPKDYWYSETGREVGDIVYEIECEDYSYDQENSTATTAYFYLENTGSETSSIAEIQIECWTIMGQKTDPLNGSVTSFGGAIEREALKIENVTQMPVLSWKIPVHNEETNREKLVEVMVSTVVARVRNTPSPEFEIVLKDGTSIKDYFDKGRKIPNKNAFTSKEAGSYAPDTTYRFDYIEVDDVEGICLDGEYYSVEEATRSGD